MGFILLILIGFIYLQLQTTSIYGGDAGDLVVAAFLKGISHPPGYPLYTAIGHLLTRLKISTPAFEVGLLSSIPASITVTLVYLITNNIIKNKICSFISALTLGFSYLFWLYSEVPEVFSLNLMLMSLLIYLLIAIDKKPRKNLLYLFFLILGLSFSHHHIILFFVPAIIFWFVIIRKKLNPLLNVKSILITFLFFLIGLLPYLYLPIAASYNPPLNWSDPVNLHNFIRLITRADYGSFTAGGFVINAPFARLYQFKAYFRFLTTDFTLIGMVLVFLGCVYQFITQRKYWYLFMAGFLMAGPIFLFYAAYPLTADFSLATYERFLLPSYIFVAVWFGYGIMTVSLIIDKLFKILVGKKSILPLITLTEIVFIVFPLSFFSAHYTKIESLKNDRTAENFGIDILDTVLPNSILILSGDTSLFNTQYVYYTQKYRPDVKLLHHSKLYREYYIEDLKNHYPNLNIPQFDDNFIANFFKENSGKFPIFSMTPIEGSGGFFNRKGLLLEHFATEEDIPSEDETIRTNIELWESYHDPTTGALSKYNHLMLSDTEKIYAMALYDLAEGLFRVNRYQDSIPHLERALKYQPYDANIHYLLGKAYFNSDKCDNARDVLLRAYELNPFLVEVYEQLSSVYQQCYSDNQKSEYYQKLFDEKKSEVETKLESL
ncbi:DUF2723 domain-containing protein [Candidatus Gottesmanbacteria bacterium]|nr:DUF2723 domain-containing protein [Candidatus Gottesmanbacteria bacterium]